MKGLLVDPQRLRDMKRALGQTLARWRRARGLTQHDVARQVHSTRSTVANVECGRQVVDRVFWAQCESLLHAGGELIAGYDDYRSVEAQHRQEQAEAARRARWAAVLDSEMIATVGSPEWSRDRGRLPPMGDVGSVTSADPSAVSVPAPHAAGFPAVRPEAVVEAAIQEVRVGGLRGGDKASQAGDTARRSFGGTGGDSDGMEGDMLRRVLLQQAITALAAGVSGSALDVIRTGLASSMSGQEAGDVDVAEWEEVGEEYGRAYYTLPPASLMLHLAGDLADLQQTLAGSRGSRRADLSRVGAQLAAVMAMSLAKTGQFQTARRWWRTCRTAADTCGDPAIRVWVRGQAAVHALYDPSSSRTIAVKRADEALAISGGRAYPGTAEALCASAQACALVGDATRAQIYTNTLTDVFGKLTGGVTADTGSIYQWPQRRLWHALSYVYSHLGQTKGALRAQQQALALMPGWAPAARAQVHLHTAMCLIRDGHLDDGASHAEQAITALPQSRRTALVVRLGHVVLDAVPEQQRRRSSVAGLREILTASASPDVA
ncbi:helix-turn-helix domain-containing protein [Micromonospora rosaria]|uniref:helix-turn-helix domain-containing protein n=1 Tax=Micromonospora rosaria TaxID=47874 RepID=UPI000AD445B5|nr:helix-turn-helix transcriptional regulator [Micromonospora rosaria]